ncbi:MAG: Unknown protein [uncultured Sulfurovum sp.]|uniref:Uncharacterized protein n=1 Tax=uncultured Sulfurovum sp. TaxID=269237 RepID=A0A6S6STA4_9BACT|nr:MAG: Unknown protein [uncultured Sulfurovum sp.]
MKFETMKHLGHTVSMVSESMANNFKDKITNEQYEILKHNVYTIEFHKDKHLEEKYNGCGCGWTEIDKDGNFVDLQYLDEDVVDWREELDADEHEMEIGVVSSQEAQALYLSTGQKEQNVNMLEFHTDQLTPLILPNGNVRVLVNFSSTQLVRF